MASFLTSENVSIFLLFFGERWLFVHSRHACVVFFFFPPLSWNAFRLSPKLFLFFYLQSVNERSQKKFFLCILNEKEKKICITDLSCLNEWQDYFFVIRNASHTLHYYLTAFSVSLRLSFYEWKFYYYISYNVCAVCVVLCFTANGFTPPSQCVCDVSVV